MGNGQRLVQCDTHTYLCLLDLIALTRESTGTPLSIQNPWCSTKSPSAYPILMHRRRGEWEVRRGGMALWQILWFEHKHSIHYVNSWHVVYYSK